MDDIFSNENFLKNFPQEESEKIACKISLVKSIDSTNTFLMEEAKIKFPLLDENGLFTQKGREFNFAMKAAESQTKGRGRMGRKFLSPISSGIYFSIALIKEGGIKDAAMITVSACTGICRAIEKTYGIECKIKWVNDIYCNGKKTCGILTEGILNEKSGRIDGCIIGIGINLRTCSSFDAELRAKAGGILDGMAAEKNIPTRTEFLSQCYRELKNIFENEENIMEEYKGRSLLTGRTVTVTPVIGDEKTSYTATVKGISEKAELMVMLENGSLRKLNSGEVSLHGTEI